MSITFENFNIQDLCEQLQHFADAQQHMAARSKEDRGHWHHVVLADLLLEAKDRLEVIEDNKT